MYNSLVLNRGLVYNISIIILIYKHNYKADLGDIICIIYKRDISKDYKLKRVLIKLNKL